MSNKINDEDVTWFPALGESDSSGDIEALMGELKEKVNQMADVENMAISKANEVFEDCNRTLKKKRQAEVPAIE